MENALKNLFAISDLRNRVLFTLAMLGVYRIGSFDPDARCESGSAAALCGPARGLDVRLG